MGKNLNSRNEDVKEELYHSLLSIIKPCPRRGWRGHLNTKIGSNNQGYEEIMEHQGRGKLMKMGRWTSILVGR